jgi:hypothetical protein
MRDIEADRRTAAAGTARGLGGEDAPVRAVLLRDVPVRAVPVRAAPGETARVRTRPGGPVRTLASKTPVTVG